MPVPDTGALVRVPFHPTPCTPTCHVPRYLLYGDVSFRVAEQLRRPEVESFFARLIQRVAPKSRDQALAEVRVTRKFYENFGGDQVRQRTARLQGGEVRKGREGRAFAAGAR